MASVSPAQLVFSNALQLNKGILLPHVTMEDKDTSWSEWTSKMLSRQHQALLVAKDTQQKRDDERIKSKSGDITVFPDNSYVLVEYFTGPPSKLHPILK